MKSRTATLALTALLAATLPLSACSGSRYPARQTEVTYYPQCYQPIDRLRQDEQLTNNTTVGGAVGGALLGALIGGLSTGKVEGALVGAAAGGAAGAIGGNIYGKRKTAERDADYLQQYARSLGEDAASMNRATAAARVSLRCYDQQFHLAANQYRAGSISRTEFEARYQEIRSGLQETSAILGSTATTMQERDREYQATLQRQEEQRAQASAPTPAPAPRATTPKTRKPRTQKAATPAPRTTPEVQRKSNEFKAAQRDLDSARQDVDKRINSYENSVAALLG